ncbi:hypothetical protein Tco_1344096 [Tanacetum coccineum]
MRITVTFHHDGIFIPSPLMYKEGDASTLRDFEFEGMTLTGLLKKLKGACQFPIKGIYFLIPGKELSNGLVEIKDDSNLAEYVGEMEDITPYGICDFLGEDNVVIPNRTINDYFLNKLCNETFISYQTNIPECSEPANKELLIDSDDEGVDTRYKVVHDVLYPEFDPSLPWNEMKPILGLRFEHPEQLKECLTNYGVANGYQLWYRRNDYQNLMVLCGRDIAEGRCGGKKRKAEGVQIESPSKGNKGKKGVQSPGKKGKIGVQSPGKKGKKGVQSPGKKGKGVESTDKKGKGVESTGKKGKCIGKKGVQKGCTFRLWASWMQDGSCFQIKTLIPEHCCSRNFDLGSLVTYKWIAKHQCKRAKQRALFDHEGGLIEHYSRLWDYRQQLLDTNPGSTVHLQIEEKENGQKHFLRFYVCFKAMKEGWSAGCRKVIGLDGCFLKGTVKGELLTAMGRDGNNQMFPIAWAVVNIENNDNWQWFLACICEDLMLGQGAYLTIISDGHKGLMEAVRTMLPYAEHRQCARHIYANFKKKWNGLHYKFLFWGAAGSTIQHQFYAKMNLIGNIDPEAKQWLVDRNPNSWCRAFFKMDRGCGAYENGISESYHNSIRIARGKPIITMLEEIRVYLMQRLYSMNNLASNLADTITPSIRKQIEHLKITQRYWTVCPCGDNNYEVRKGDESFGVNIEKRICSCNWWTLSGVPCVHTVAAYCFLKTDPALVGGSAMWPNTREDPPLPPVQRKMPGRPRKLRIKHVTERDNVISRSGRQMTCQKAGDARPNTAAGSATVVDESGPTGVDESGQTVVDESGVEVQMEATEVVEASIAAGTLKLAGVKRRGKSERIANKAKAFKFGKDGAGSSADKAWDVNEVFAEP